MSQNICFYSNKCPWSKAFLTELAQTSYKASFQFICVDPSPSRPPLPKWLKKTPTLVVSGSPDPLTDSEVMNWLYEKRMKDGSSQQQGAPSSVGADPMGFNTIEQVSFAKGFSYSGLDTDTSSQGSGGMTMPGAFSFLGSAAAPGEKTGQDFLNNGNGGGGAAGDRKKTRKEELFDKQMEAYQRDRDSGIPKGPPRQ